MAIGLESYRHLTGGPSTLLITDDTTTTPGSDQAALAQTGEPSAAMFRGNAARTGVYPDGGPTSAPELLWKFKTGEREGSSPVVADGVVYVAGSDWNVYALDAQDGEETWSHPTGRGATSSPAVAGGMVYFGTADGYLCALDAATGRERWNFEASGPIYSSPVVADGAVYFGDYDGRLWALDAESGRERRNFEADRSPYGTAIISSPALSGGVVYFGGADGYLYALDAASGQEKWRLRDDANQSAHFGFSSSPAVVDGVVYFTTWDSYLYAVDTASRQVKWQSTVNDDQSSPAVSDGVVFSLGGSAGGWDSPAVALDADTGEELWRFPKSTMRLYGLGTDPSPSVSGSAVYFLAADDDIRLRALDAKTGEELWSWVVDPNPSFIHTSPTISDGVVYVSGPNGYLYALR